MAGVPSPWGLGIRNTRFVTEAAYDRIGVDYAKARRTDPRIAARIAAALGNARSVLNVGAGAGSYEPLGREVTAVEPSAEMISQRPSGSAPVVQASAEALPFENDSFDAAMAIMSDHHWRERRAGLLEMARVSRHRVLLLNADPSLALEFWLTRDYLPGFADLIPGQYRQKGRWRAELESLLGEVEVQTVLTPHDCLDGFYQAYWRRPSAYCDERIRRGVSVFHRLPEDEVADAMKRLRRDLDDGTWNERNAGLLGLSELDVGLRLVTAKADVPSVGERSLVHSVGRSPMGCRGPAVPLHR
jgi:SAM-dependent methyltransferase